MKAITQTYKTIEHWRSQIIIALSIFCLLMIVSYIANIFSVISHTLAIKKIQSESASVETSVRDLDSKYLELAGKITPDRLAAYGLKEGKVSQYISKTESLGVALGAHEL